MEKKLLNALVVHYEVEKIDRATISEHLNSFDKYLDGEVTYVNAFYGIPHFLSLFKFDVIIFHYTFLSQKWNGGYKFRKLLNKCEILKEISGYKIAMPQDEYVHSDLICDFVKEFKIDSLYTCFYEKDYEKVYPVSKTGNLHLETNLTGYVDSDALKKVASFYKPHKNREVDIGYRARKLPFWLGAHGTIKWRLTEIFTDACSKRNLNIDLSNDERKVFLGDSWYEFLSNSRVVLGCEGGASLLDVDGSIRARVDKFVKMNPGASFLEVEKNCFPGLDGNISLFAISPRHFEAAMTKTTQVLVEGSYHGIFKANVHYIELKKDFSNIEEVLDKVEDVAYCEKIAENAYREIVLSEKFSYLSFIQSLPQKHLSKTDQLLNTVYGGIAVAMRLGHRFLISLKSIYMRVYDVNSGTINAIRVRFFPLLVKLGLLRAYRAIKQFFANL